MTAREARALLLSAFALAISLSAALFLNLPEAAGPPGMLERVFWSIRLPEALTALFAGGALGLSGLLFQLLLRNGLADPYVLGVAGGASFGAVLATLLFGSSALALLVPVKAAAAFAGGILTLLALLRLTGGRPGTLLLAGVVANTAFAASARVLTGWLSPAQLVQVTTFLVGFVPTPPIWAPLLLAVPALYTLARFFWRARGLDVLLLSDDEALSLGVPVASLRREALVLATLLAAATVTLCGMLGFVGLMVPHGARLLAGHRHRILVPVSFLLGAGFVLLAHGLSKLLSGSLFVPVGVYTSLVGAPAFVVLLVKQTRRALA
jgi:iron complex transport system permease protein